MPLDDTRVEIAIPNREEVAIIDKILALIPTPSRWVKNHTEYRGRYCLIGAFAKVEYGHPDLNHVEVIASPAWHRLTELAGCGPVNFNDNPETRHKDIIALLRKARASFE